MVAIIRTEWSGTSGGPGLTQIAVLGAAGGTWNPGGTQGAVNAMRVFWDAIKGTLPDELKLTVSPVIDVYDETNGTLTASYVAATTPTQVTGSSAAAYAGGIGYKVTWNTNQIRNGRRVRGATFVVPAASTVFGLTGTVTTASIATVNNAAGNLISTLSANTTPMAVWSRPINEGATRLGVTTEVVTGTCSAKSAIMRGRRD